VSAGTKATIIEFIREHLDPGLRNIELVKDQHFLADHEGFAEAPSLANFGQGMQQIFRTGLLFASARGGIVLIDEIDNAIHASLLHQFAGLIGKLADLLDVQVFLTTHSKEAISAFVQSEQEARQCAGYAISREGEQVRARGYPGEQLARLKELVDFDLRSP